MSRAINEGEDERSGRWRGQDKTECGIHNPKSKFARFLREQENRAAKQEEALHRALHNRLGIEAR